MAFWGTEVKPGKPYTHSFDRVRGRLHISQATLSIGTSVKKSLVQCNVGDKSPVLLCALLPDKTESLQLDLEFEETDDVIFSVIGPRGVHLTGYYVGGCRNSNFQDDTESYGEDIKSETEESNRCADEEDEYDDSFINDGEPETLSPSPVSSDGESSVMRSSLSNPHEEFSNWSSFVSPIETSDYSYVKKSPHTTLVAAETQRIQNEEEVYIKKKKDGKGGRNRLKKRYQLVESDDDTCSQQNIVNGSINVAEIDDDDKCPISSVCKSKATTIDIIPELAKEKSDEVTKLSLETSNKMKGDDSSSLKTKADGSDVVDSTEKVNNDEPKSKEVPNGTALMPAAEEVPENRTKAKKKRKGLSKESKQIDDNVKEGKLPQFDEEITQKSDQNLLVEDKRDLEVAMNKTSDVPCSSIPPPVEAGLENGKKSKKKRKNNSKNIDPLKEDKGQEAEAKVETIDQDVQLKNKDDDDRTMKEMETDHLHESVLPSADVGPERSSKGKRKRKERTEVKADFSGSDLLVGTEQDQKLTVDKSLDIVSEQLGDEYQSDDKKLKKKRRKKNIPEETEGNGNVEVKEVKNTPVMETEQNVDARASEARTLSNGLIIEDLGTRNSKGRKAAPGKKVKVQYTVKLKESGLVIDSNIGKSPYKFRLGDKEVIEGLNVGLEGMRVGDKRRLIIPPSMSSGSEGTGENVPPNSWLVYDVDLVGVN